MCGTLGALLLVILVAACLPLTLPPPVFGYHIYTVLSGSMEPAIPVGSLSYIQETAPEDMKEKDVIAYYGGSDRTAIITHRVVENRVFMGEFVTKGDANPDEDMMHSLRGLHRESAPVHPPGGQSRPGALQHAGEDRRRLPDRPGGGAAGDLGGAGAPEERVNG